ncbi:aminodeoxychorismate synthase component I [Pseudoalteromonas tunicata]|uniref:aminodeoxychorismate synthase n=1 Tax=Pseudoalteromonas tunicata D2 TaxID=87626 RepID=A4CBL9_9GAMM|nr:aminodeoxychorismate synthase component I [Pseudoalteromonas tunicata]ATC94312.1 para-aminobenzoate synthetase component I [Pseudoalteromonas tunicata]AXT30054.1 aminodeoxychorismate synthase component I [Pseudoalteromonas tunicata]EAR27756.1 aminodeoxychorismate synthase subunit I [Pseudoalteromonas tunicata D2]
MINEQISCKKLDIRLNTTELFSKFADQAWAILLDSANPTNKNDQFDIISFAPINVVEAKEGQCFIDGKVAKESPFSALKNLLARFSQAKAPEHLPFTGGLLGYFAYDLGRYLETMPTLCCHDISLPDMAVGLYPDALVYHHGQQCWFYISQPGFDRLALYQTQLNHTVQTASFSLCSAWLSNMDKTSYSQKFSQIQDYLRSGDCYQINLAQRFSAQFCGAPWQAYLTLRDKNQAPFSAYINHPDGQIASISPERFIKVKEGLVETKPIKGTLARSSDPIEDKQRAEQLKHSAKDRAENVMIVDLLRNDLGKVAAPGSVLVPHLFEIESYPAVHHLVSTVTSILADDKTALDQLEAAFPGGSITGAPKIRAMEIIEELEPHQRSVYCGSIGYISACGNMDTSITIRTLVFNQAKVHCWAGGGIVADSKVDSEYQETYDKVNKILPVLL